MANSRGAVARHRAEAVLDRSDVQAMIVARESDRDDLTLLLGMVLQTCLAFIATFPELAAVRDAGLGPVTDPHKYGAEEHRGPGYRAVIWHVGRVLFVYYRGSAAKEEDGDNDFTRLMIDLIEAVKPPEVRVAVFTRLARSNTAGGDLLRAIKQHRAVVWCGDLRIEVWTQAGEMYWMMLMMIASFERVSIVLRTVLGRIAAAARQESPFGRHVTPLGYKRDGKRLVPDPDMKEAVAEMLQMLTDPAMSSVEFTRRCGQLGFTRPRLKELYGETATVADAVEAKDIRSSIVGFLPLYEHGQWVMRMKNPLPEIEQYAEIEVEPVEGTDKTVIPIPYEWGVPPGGWAPPEVFELIRTAERCRRQGRVGNHRPQRRPFTGRTWLTGSRHWRIESTDATHYVIASYPTDSSGQALQRRDRTLSKEGRRVEARLDTAQFHSSVFTAVVDSLEQAGGLPATINNHLVAGRSINSVEARRATMLSRATKLDKRSERARHRSYDIDDEVTARGMLQDAAQLAKEATTVRAAALALVEEQLAEPIEVDTRSAAAALAALSMITTTAPKLICDALDRVLVDLELRIECNELNWSVYLAAPAGGLDIAVLGPICGKAPMKKWQRGIVGPAPPTKRRNVCIEALRAGKSLTDMQCLPESSNFRYLQGELTDVLQHAGLHRIVAQWAVTVPIPAVRQLLAGVALDGHLPNLPGNHDELTAYLEAHSLVPTGCDPRWAATLVQRHVQSTPRRTRWVTSAARRRNILGQLTTLGGTATLRELATASGVGRGIIVAELLQASWNGWAPVLEWVDEPAQIRGVRRPYAESQVALKTCPHCREWMSFALNAVEVDGDLLCPSCLRTQAPDSPVYPADYLKTPVCGTGVYAKSSMSNNIRLRAGSENYHRRTRRHELAMTAKDRDSIADAYRNGHHIAGPGGILDTWDISTSALYRLIDAAKIPRRHATRIARRTAAGDDDKQTCDPTPRPLTVRN